MCTQMGLCPLCVQQKVHRAPVLYTKAPKFPDVDTDPRSYPEGQHHSGVQLAQKSHKAESIRGHATCREYLHKVNTDLVMMQF